MAIYELGPKHKIGPIKLGEKLGQRIDEVCQSVEVETRTWDEGQGSISVGNYDQFRRWHEVGKEPRNWWSYGGDAVIIKGSDRISHIKWADDDSYGYVQSDQGELVGDGINQHPIIGKHIRYIPD